MLSKKTLVLTAALATLSTATWASILHKPTMAHKGMMSHMTMHKPSMMMGHKPMMMGHKPMMMGHGKPAMGVGEIIGNVHTHVYHLPGSKDLPAMKNRVYFHSVAAAVAKGYHAEHGGDAHKKMTPAKKAHMVAKKKMVMKKMVMKKKHK